MRPLYLEEEIKLFAGDTPTIAFPITVEGGGVFDPEGARGKFIVSRKAGATGDDVFFTKDTVDASASFATAGGVVSLKAPLVEDDTRTLAPGKYWYEAVIIEPGNGRGHIAAGPFTVRAATDV